MVVSTGGGEDPLGYGCRQCVSYAAWKTYQKTGYATTLLGQRQYVAKMPLAMLVSRRAALHEPMLLVLSQQGSMGISSTLKVTMLVVILSALASSITSMQAVLAGVITAK